MKGKQNSTLLHFGGVQLNQSNTITINSFVRSKLIINNPINKLPIFFLLTIFSRGNTFFKFLENINVLTTHGDVCKRSWLIFYSVVLKYSICC